MLPSHTRSSLPHLLSAALVSALAATTAAQSRPVGWADLRSIQPVSMQAMAYDAARQRIVSFGGSRSGAMSFNSTQDTWEWNGTSWHERTSAAAPSPRANHAMAYDSARGRVVLFGDYGQRDDTWEWDGSTWVERQPATRPLPSFGYAMAYDTARQRSVLWIGAAAQTWEWDGTNWLQRTTSPRPPSGFSSSMAYDESRARTVCRTNGETWEWDGTSWSRVMTAAVPPEGVLVYDAGQTRTTLVAGNGALWDFDGVAWTQRVAGSAGTFGEFAAVYDSGRREIVRFDSLPPNQSITPPFAQFKTLAVTAVWNGSTWVAKHRSGGSADCGVDAPALAYDPVRGGVSAIATHWFGTDLTGQYSVYRSRLKLWDGRSWIDQGMVVSNSYSPTQAQAATAFDTRRGVLVCFGGRDPGCVGRGCNESDALAEWNGSTWALPQPATSPAGRVQHAMAFDATRNETVLFGGANNRGFILLGDTWVWNGTNWTDRTPANSPSARNGHGMAFDIVHRRTVLFGGSAIADTWEWDGAQWLQRNPAHQPPAGTAALCWHPGWQRVVAYVGSGLWTWDGTDWTQLLTTQPLPASNGRSMAYDPTRDALIVAGNGITRILGSGVVQAAVATIGAGCASTARVPTLSAPPPALGDAGFGFALDGAPANAPCVLGLASQQRPITVGGCTFHLGGVVITLPLPSSSYGHADAQLSVPFNRALLGLELFAQGISLDPRNAPLGLALSNAIRVTVGE